MRVSVSRNFGPLDQLQLLTREDWGRVGRLARERLVTRTLTGRDEHDKAFAPYSRGYAAVKAAQGASGRVDLQLSGEMLRGITVSPDETGVTLGLSS